MLDLSAAFDKIDHDVLLTRMEQSFGKQFHPILKVGLNQLLLKVRSLNHRSSHSVSRKDRCLVQSFIVNILDPTVE